MGGGSNAIGMFSAFLEDKEALPISITGQGNGKKKDHLNASQSGITVLNLFCFTNWTHLTDDGRLFYNCRITNGFSRRSTVSIHVWTFGECKYSACVICSEFHVRPHLSNILSKPGSSGPQALQVNEFWPLGCRCC